MPPTETVLADTPAALAHALERLNGLNTVGIDVERADWDRYFRAAALIQVGGDGRVALVDPLALGAPALAPLAAFLAGRACVLHAMENDLGPLGTLGIDPPDLEDTSIAAAVLGLPLGLEYLLRELLGVELVGDKAAMQRANWEARPLTADMLTYAAGDVADLPALWRALWQRLEQAGRTSWYQQELEAVRSQPPVEERRAWTRTKGIGRLDPLARARLRSLWEAREGLARSSDTAPSRIASDKLLVDLAVRPPSNTGELTRRGLRRAAVREWGSALLRAVTLADNGEGGLAQRPDGPPRLRTPDDRDRAKVDLLRVLRTERAAELGIDPGVLCPSRVLLGAVLADPATPEELERALGLRPWQWEQLGPAFCEALELGPVGKTDTWLTS
jgi:ribonuclease D